tara:strand:- start:38831 stop:40420 length:1590 start_codon:yes stop_codon:yes gene_type:complete
MLLQVMPFPAQTVAPEVYSPRSLALGATIVAPGSSSDFDQTIREIGNILHDPADTGKEYKLVYSGHQGAYSGVTYVGYVYSSDGVNWTKGGKLTLGANRASEDPYLVKVGSTYYLYVEDKSDVPFRDIRCYTSTDFVTWADQGEVLGPTTGWEAQDVSSPTVFREGATWYMLYEGRASGQEGAIGLATSSDGLTWTRSASNPVVRGQNASFGFAGAISWSNGIVPDDIIKTGSTYVLHFHGRGFNSGVWDFRAGVATSSDLIDWTDAIGAPLASISRDCTTMLHPQAGTFIYVFPGEGIRMALPGAGDPDWSSVVVYVPGYAFGDEDRFNDIGFNWNEVTSFGNTKGVVGGSATASSSILLDGSGDYLTVSPAPEANLGSSDFTIEAWVKRAATGQMMIVTKAGSSLSAEAWYLDHTGTDLRFVYRINSTTVAVLSSSTAMTVGTWYHVAVERSGNTFRLYKNGIVLNTVTDSRPIQSVSTAVGIGARIHPTPLYFNGRIEGVRISKVARYGGAFTPPTAPFPVGPVGA